MSDINPPTSQGPLAGVTVVELGDGASAPYAAKLFGDLGAEVIKVEGPDGDSSRKRGPFPDGRPDPEASGLFMYLNVNKFGVMVDLDTNQGVADMHKLLSRADVFMTNVPAIRLTALGLDAVTLRAQYPKLVVTTISPFGVDGPW